MEQYRTFSSFLREKFGHRVQKITLDAGLTCPHRDNNKLGGCIYCNAYGSGTNALQDGKSIKDQIDFQIEGMKKRYKAQSFIAYFQSYSNTYAPIDQLKKIYDYILTYPEIVGLAIGTRPDCVDADVLDLISSYAKDRLVWIEYGLQSAHDETLKRINRGHDVQAFVDAVNLTAKYPLRICAHVIIGLPGEDAAMYEETAKFVARLPITDIKIHLLYVVKGTPMEEMYKAGGYAPLTMEEYANAVARFIAHLPKHMVIQRITGDPHPKELVAPMWALKKKKAMAAIHAAMKAQGLFQGSFYESR